METNDYAKGYLYGIEVCKGYFESLIFSKKECQKERNLFKKLGFQIEKVDKTIIIRDIDELKEIIRTSDINIETALFCSMKILFADIMMKKGDIYFHPDKNYIEGYYDARKFCEKIVFNINKYTSCITDEEGINIGDETIFYYYLTDNDFIEKSISPEMYDLEEINELPFEVRFMLAIRHTMPYFFSLYAPKK